MSDAIDRLETAVRDSGLVPEGSTGVALLSGGPDSACLAAGLVAAVGAGNVTGLHVNYGLRPDSGEDQAKAAALCEGLGIRWLLHMAVLDTDEEQFGNLQAEARDARYEAAEVQRASQGADWIATGHTRTDVAETMIYRLASSPGRRALLGLPARRGHIVRPLLALTREETRALATEAGLPFHDDPSNEDPSFARARIRAEVLPVLREISPSPEATISATRAELAEEAEALEALALEALSAAGSGPGADVVAVAGLADAPAAIRRLAVRALAERVAGRQVAVGRDRFAEIWRLASSPEGGQVDLGGGLTATCEAGFIRISAAATTDLDPVSLAVPGECAFGPWRIRAQLAPNGTQPRGPDVATLSASALAEHLTVRSREEGDRMRPLGLDGTKSLQDLLTDAGVPRSLRDELPVVISAGEIAWIAGVAVGEEFRLATASEPAVILTATR